MLYYNYVEPVKCYWGRAHFAKFRLGKAVVSNVETNVALKVQCGLWIAKISVLWSNTFMKRKLQAVESRMAMTSESTCSHIIGNVRHKYELEMEYSCLMYSFYISYE